MSEDLGYTADLYIFDFDETTLLGDGEVVEHYTTNIRMFLHVYCTMKIKQLYHLFIFISSRKLFSLTIARLKVFSANYIRYLIEFAYFCDLK